MQIANARIKLRRTSCKFFRRPLIWFFAKKSLSNKIEPIEILDRVKDFLITFNITMKKRRMKSHEMWHLMLMNLENWVLWPRLQRFRGQKSHRPCEEEASIIIVFVKLIYAFESIVDSRRFLQCNAYL